MNTHTYTHTYMHSFSFLGALVNNVDPDQMMQKVKKVQELSQTYNLNLKLICSKALAGHWKTAQIQIRELQKAVWSGYSSLFVKVQEFL